MDSWFLGVMGGQARQGAILTQLALGKEVLLLAFLNSQKARQIIAVTPGMMRLLGFLFLSYLLEMVITNTICVFFTVICKLDYTFLLEPYSKSDRQVNTLLPLQGLKGCDQIARFVSLVLVCQVSLKNERSILRLVAIRGYRAVDHL